MGGANHSTRRMNPMAVGKHRVQCLEMKHRVNQSRRNGASRGRFQNIPLVKKVVMPSQLVVCTWFPSMLRFHNKVTYYSISVKWAQGHDECLIHHVEFKHNCKLSRYWLWYSGHEFKRLRCHMTCKVEAHCSICYWWHFICGMKHFPSVLQHMVSPCGYYQSILWSSSIA